MSEDLLSQSSSSLLDGTGGDAIANNTLLGNNDIVPRIYEGGLKSWECSQDLTEYLLNLNDTCCSLTERDERTARRKKVLELGCGTALPTLSIFRGLLLKNNSCDGNSGGGAEFVLADYNLDVLRLVTLPNLLLSWWAARHRNLRGHAGDMAIHNERDGVGVGDIKIDEQLKTQFQQDLKSCQISIKFLEGAWGSEMANMLADDFDLVLASETIYNPETVPAFVNILKRTIGNRSAGCRALVAAKKMYFGVGGSVDDFATTVCHRNSTDEQDDWEVETVADVVDTGVGRVILRVVRK